MSLDCDGFIDAIETEAVIMLYLKVFLSYTASLLTKMTECGKSNSTTTVYKYSVSRKSSALQILLE